jgi:hypothetical protein
LIPLDFPSRVNPIFILVDARLMLHDAVARTSGVAVPHPASARGEGSGTPAGRRASGRPGGERPLFGRNGSAGVPVNPIFTQVDARLTRQKYLV